MRLNLHNTLEPVWINFAEIHQSVKLCDMSKSKAVIL